MPVGVGARIIRFRTVPVWTRAWLSEKFLHLFNIWYAVKSLVKRASIQPLTRQSELSNY